LTIIKTKNGNIFGAFAEEAWTHDTWTNVLSLKAFIISLINKENKPFEAMINPQGYDGNYYYALNCDSSKGPCFGRNHGYLDITIASNSNANQSSSSYFGRSFQHQDYPEGSEKAQTILAGSQKFQTIDIEVFTKNN